MPGIQANFMCRIAGIISPSLSENELTSQVVAMCKVLANGGPDDEGIFLDAEASLSFGHRRLSIIDLSRSGHQPMADAAKRAWITFNGEIYNYIELKAQLISEGAAFSSETDTEVILQAYLHWGSNAFFKLKGMFAFALYDIAARQTWLVRDSAGIKPLYYFTDGKQLYFASEVKAIKNSGLNLTDDENWPVRFLAFGHIPEPYTIYKHVLSLPKGHSLCWNHQTKQYTITAYTNRNAATTINTATAAEHALKVTLEKAVNRQLIADAPIGVFLSGGIDSSLLTLLAARYKQRLKTVSICFDDEQYNEQKYQQAVLANIDTEHHQHLVKKEDLDAFLPEIIAAMDLPTTDGINSWFISKYAHESGLKAVLSGIGADEQFGGYPSFKRVKYLQYARFFPNFLKKGFALMSKGKFKRVELLAHRHPVAEYLFLRGLFSPSEIAAVLKIPKSKVLEILFSVNLDVNGLTGASKVAWFETNMYMQNQLLRDTDVLSMAHGLEVRVPFLDEDLRALIGSITPAVRYSSPPQKKLLINTFKELLPETVWNRTKMGFSFPLQIWMRTHAEISNPTFYQNDVSKKYIRQFRENKVHWSKVFALYHLRLRLPYTQAAHKKLLYLTLSTFSTTGGVQKMGRTMGYALQNIAIRNNWAYKFWSGYDTEAQLNEAYTDKQNFKGYGKNRALFAADALREGIQSDEVILSHINLATVGCMIKRISPETKVWLIAHGIEVWRPLKSYKRKILQLCDKIVCVSNYTRDKMIELHGIDASKFVVLNNALDPLMRFPQQLTRPVNLLGRYHLKPDDKIIFSLTRLASTEKYKGYEQVIVAVSRLKGEFKNLKYVLAGQYDHREGLHIRSLIKRYKVENNVIITGFVKNEELEDHFLMADLFVLPSKKEGFGIVFIEAMACGLPVICGDGDGSLDAIKHGELGTAVNADNIDQLTEAIRTGLNKPANIEDKQKLQQACVQYFNADGYTDRLEQLLKANFETAHNTN